MTLLRSYEAILLASPELNDEGVAKLQTQFGEAVTRLGGRVLESGNLGKRKLSYRMKRVHEAVTLQVRFEAPPAAVAPLKKAASLMEEVLRLMVLQETPRATPAPPQTRAGKTMEGSYGESE